MVSSLNCHAFNHALMIDHLSNYHAEIDPWSSTAATTLSYLNDIARRFCGSQERTHAYALAQRPNKKQGVTGHVDMTVYIYNAQHQKSLTFLALQYVLESYAIYMYIMATQKSRIFLLSLLYILTRTSRSARQMAPRSSVYTIFLNITGTQL